MGESIRAARESQELSQRELAYAVGVHPSAVHHWEVGRVSPTPEHRERLANVIDTNDDPVR